MAKAKTKTTAKARSKSKSKGKKPKQKRGSSKGLRKTKPTKLDDKTIDELARIVGLGNFRYVARQQLGIPEGTFKTWLSRGRADIRDDILDTPQARLVIALDKAEGDVHASIVRNVMTADPTDPRVLKIQTDYLYRRHGKLYSRNLNAHDDDTGETHQVNPLDLLAEKLKPFLTDDETDEP
jgi:hypothetical protein